MTGALVAAYLAVCFLYLSCLQHTQLLRPVQVPCKKLRVHVEEALCKNKSSVIK